MTETSNNQSTIKIFARVRPIRHGAKIKSASERYWINNLAQDSRPTIGFHVPRDQAAGLINNQKETFDFQFDRLFDMDTKQEEVFDHVAKPVIQRFVLMMKPLMGINSHLVAYKVIMELFSHMDRYNDMNFLCNISY